MIFAKKIWLKRWGYLVHLYIKLAFPQEPLKHNSRRDIRNPARRCVAVDGVMRLLETEMVSLEPAARDDDDDVIRPDMA